MKILLFVLATFLGTCSWAQTIDSYARQVQGTYIKSIEMGYSPSYFFRVSPDGNYLGSTKEVETDKYQNFITDIRNKKHIKIPGTFDPVFAPTGRFILTNQVGKFLNIYSLPDILAQSLKVLFGNYIEQLKVSGYYQSIGHLSTSGQTAYYRILIQHQDYVYPLQVHEIAENFNQKNITTSVKIYRSAPICAYEDMKLPIISKDGKEFGTVYNNSTTQIFKLTDNLECQLDEDLGIRVGKLSFSYDGRYVAFHSYHPRTSEGYIKHPQLDIKSDIYVYDRHLKKFYEITDYKDANGMYPDFLPDGTITWIVFPHSEPKNSVVYFYKPSYTKKVLPKNIVNQDEQ